MFGLCKNYKVLENSDTIKKEGIKSEFVLDIKLCYFSQCDKV